MKYRTYKHPGIFLALLLAAGVVSMPASADTISVRVSLDSDDAEEQTGNGSVDNGGNDIEIGEDRIGGFRFQNITIPPGAIINSATIQFTADRDDGNNPSSVTITGQDTDNAATFLENDNDISNRTQTTASVTWNNLNAWVQDDAGPDQLTPDLAAIVQEIIDRPGWASGNAMAFILDPTGAERRRVRTHNRDPNDAPLLFIDFTLPLTVDKTDSIDPIAVGRPLSYSLTVTNNLAVGSITSITLTDTLPAEFTFSQVFTSQGNCNEAGGVVTCNLGTLAAGASAVVDISGFAGTFSTVMTNNASVSGTAPDTSTVGGSASEQTTVTGAIPQLCYTVADSGDLLTQADTFDFNPATNETTIGPTTGATQIEAIAWNSGMMILYAANANRLGTLNTSTGAYTALPSPFGTGNGVYGAYTMNDVDGLAYDATSGILYGSEARTAGDGLDLLFQINQATGALVPNAFGAGVDYVAIMSGAFGTTIDDIAIDRTTGIMYGAVNAGASSDRLIIINKFTGAVTDVGVLTQGDIEGLGTDGNGALWGVSGTANELYEIDKATGAGSLGRPLDNGGDYESIDCFATSPSFQVDIAVAKSVDNAVPEEGEQIEYTVTATNNGPANAASVTIQDVLPAGLTFVSATPSQGIYNSTSGDWFAGTIANGSNATLTLRATIDPGEAGNTITNTASLVSVAQVDSNSANNTADVDITVQTRQIGVAKQVSAGPTNNGDGTHTLTYQVLVENSGQVLISSLQVVDDLDTTFSGATGYTVDSVTSGDFAVNGSYDGSTDTNLLAGSDTLAPGVSGSVLVTVTVTPGSNLGPYNNSATASGQSPAGSSLSDVSANGPVPDANGNGDPGDDSTPTPVSFLPTADLSVTKTDGSATYTPGTTATYTIVVNNAGPNAANGTAVTDTFPAGVTLSGAWSCAAAGGASCGAASGGSAGDPGFSDGPNLPASSSVTYTVPVQFSAVDSDY